MGEEDRQVLSIYLYLGDVVVVEGRPAQILQFVEVRKFAEMLVIKIQRRDLKHENKAFDPKDPFLFMFKYKRYNLKKPSLPLRTICSPPRCF